MDRNYVNEGEPGRQGHMAVDAAFGGDKLKASLAAKELNKTGASGMAGKPPPGAGSTMNASKSKVSSMRGPKKQPSTTKGTQMLQQHTRAQMEKDLANKEKKDKEDAERKERQNRVSTH